MAWSKGLNPGTPDEEPSVAKLEAKSIHLAMAAAKMAWADSGLDKVESGHGYDPHRFAVAIGSAFGGQDLLGSRDGSVAQTEVTCLTGLTSFRV